MDSVENIALYGREQGLPSDKQNYVYSYMRGGNKEVLIGSDSGFYSFDYASDAIVPVVELNEALPYLGNVRNGLAMDEKGNILCAHEKSFLYLEKQPNQKYLIDTLSFMPIYDIGLDEINYLGNQVFAISCSDGLFLFDANKRYQSSNAFQSLIRSVSANKKVIYGGAGVPKEGQIDYEANNLLFRFSAPYTGQSEYLRFSYQLEGLDEEWSEWTSITFKEYTNLWEGAYTFKVKAKNLYNEESSIATYYFTVGPPIHRTAWAYLGYLLLGIGAIWLGVKWYTAKLKRENEKLEQIIADRTKEISSQKEEIAIQAEELATTNDKLLEIGDFRESMTGMIVHDLKNPLSVIIQTEQLPDSAKQMATQMLQLVNNMLDVHKSERVGLNVNLKDNLLQELVNTAVEQVQLLTIPKNIQINTAIPVNLAVKVDEALMLRVFTNFLTNAIKYSPSNGHITIKATEGKSEVKISIEDEGQGIAQENIGTIFQQFTQIDPKKSGIAASTGLGLAFCKLAIQAHGSEIEVDSEVGKGTAFSFRLGIGQFDDGERGLLTSKERAVFTHKEREVLELAISKLEGLKVYEASEIARILDEQASLESTASTAQWKKQVMYAAFSSDQRYYDQLLKFHNESS